jgi:hypothetical protein
MPSSPPLPAEAEDQEAQIRRDASLLLQFLQADPMAKAYIDRTIRQHLQGGVGMETWGNILGGLTMYAGEDVTRFVLMVLLSADDLLGPEDTGYLALVEKHVGVEVWSYLRGLLAMYSPGVKEAYAITGEPPQGSRTINRRVFYDEITELWQATFEIIKYNGERFYLEETPTTAIGLCNAILDTLNFMPVEEAQQAVDRLAVENLVGLFYTFVERFAPDLLEEGEEA